MENLHRLADELKAIYKEIEKNRLYWDDHLKPLVLKTFNAVKNKVDLNLKVRKIDDIRNLEAVRLTFGYLNSGLFVEQKKKKQELPPMVLVKKGGYLSYSQIANGKISVFIHYPYIEGIYGDPENILELGVFSPSDLDRTKILNHTEQFLEEIIKWEKEEKKLIGFHTGRKK